MLCCNLAKQHTGDHFLKNMACTKADRLLGGDFHAVFHKIEADMFQITNK